MLEDFTEIMRRLHSAVVEERNTILQLAVSLALAVGSGNEAEIERLRAAILTFGDQSVNPKLYHRNEGL